jgi:hypothetical protein
MFFFLIQKSSAEYDVYFFSIVSMWIVFHIVRVIWDAVIMDENKRTFRVSNNASSEEFKTMWQA